jgi:hypothetical protein
MDQLDDRKVDDVRALLRTHMAEEANAGFPRLSRIPSSSVIKFLDYAATLAPADLDSLLDAKAHGGALGFFSPLLVRARLMEVVNNDPTLLRYRAAMQSAEYSMGMRYQGLRMMKAMLNDPMSVKMIAETRSKLSFVPRDDLPPALVPDPDIAHLKPAKAPLTKKLIDRALKDLFATGKEREHGETAYTGSIDGVNLKVSVDFNAMGLQLRYGITIPDETKTIWFWHRTYEDLWGAGQGWDYLTEENAEASVQLLCDLIVQVVRLRKAVMSLRASSA